MTTLFPTEISQNLFILTGFGTISEPNGYSMSSKGTYINNCNPGAPSVYGLTTKSGDITFVYISPYVMTNIAASSQAGLIGHELIHAQNIQENPAMYQQNRAQFNLNSELAAYSYQYNFAITTGDTVSANVAYAQMSAAIAKGATGGFFNVLHQN